MRPLRVYCVVLTLSACAASTVPSERDAGADSSVVVDVSAVFDVAPLPDSRDAAAVLDGMDRVDVPDVPDVRADSGCLVAPDVSPAHPPPADPRCPSGRWQCGGACIDLVGNDPDNCGGCGIHCCGGWCFSGTCGTEGPPGTSGCPSGCRTDCVGPVPVQVYVDTRNCGACGVVCGTGQFCNAGLCRGIADAAPQD